MILSTISRFPALTLRAALFATAAAGVPALAQTAAPADATTTALLPPLYEPDAGDLTEGAAA